MKREFVEGISNMKIKKRKTNEPIAINIDCPMLGCDSIIVRRIDKNPAAITMPT